MSVTVRRQVVVLASVPLVLMSLVVECTAAAPNAATAGVAGLAFRRVAADQSTIQGCGDHVGCSAGGSPAAHDGVAGTSGAADDESGDAIQCGRATLAAGRANGRCAVGGYGAAAPARA